MPVPPGRNLHHCFKKFKLPLEHECPSSMSPTDPMLIKNYNSLYDNTFHQSTSSSLSSASSLSSSFDDEAEPDFATVYASKRFFFSSPGLSNSIVESTSSINALMRQTPSDSSSNCKSSEDDHPHESLSSRSSVTVQDSVAISTYSPDPYMDFRRSMQEMVEARGGLVDVKANWDYLHELLSCYLSLNPKSTHKFIVGAFADLLVSLLSSSSLSSSSSSSSSSSRQPDNDKGRNSVTETCSSSGGCEIPSRQCL